MAVNPTLNVRYPKLSRGQPSAISVVPNNEQPLMRSLVVLRPSAYAQARNVWPWVCARTTTNVNDKFTGKFYTARAGAAAGSSLLSIAVTPGLLTAAQYDLFVPNVADALGVCPEVTLPTLNEEYCGVPTFDLLTNATFRDQWNGLASGPNSWMVMLPAIATPVANAGSVSFDSAGAVIVQAPDTINRTQTMLPMWDTNDGPSLAAEYSGLVKRKFTYRASDFSALSAVRLCLFAVVAVTGRTLTLRIRDSNDVLISASTVVIPVRGIAGGAFAQGIGFVSEDLKGFLVDGQTYYLSMEPSQADVFSAPRAINYFLLFDQQQGFSRTSTYYCFRQSPVGFSTAITAANRHWGGGDLLAPIHFANVTNFIRPFREWCNARKDTIQSTGELRTKQKIEQDASRICAYNSDPDFIVGSQGVQPGDDIFLENTLTGVNSAELPTNCIGDRTLHLRAESNIGGASNRGGFSGAFISITFDVPTGLAPALGNLFDVGDFNPIGCVSTAAGGGTAPTVLLISNGAAIPKKFYGARQQVGGPSAGQPGGQIEDAGLPQPYPGEVPPPGNILVENHNPSPNQLGLTSAQIYTYVYTYRNCCTNKESNPSDTWTVDTTGAAPAAKVTISFSGITISGDDQICEICVYRTVGGGAFPALAKVGCFDPELTTTFVDTLGDSQLDFTADGLSLLNAPPPCVPYLVSLKRRIFGAGAIQIPNWAGTVSVQNGSKFVEGDFDVVWDRCLEGKYFRVIDDCREYQIQYVLPPTVGTSPAISRLQLYEEFSGNSEAGKLYVVCGDPNAVYYSEPEEPESWPVVNQIPVEPGDGDFITMLGSSYDRLIICKRTKTYTADYTEIPALEIVDPNRISPDIGSVGPRTFSQVESGSVWLADRGIAYFDGRGVQHLPVSDGISDIFIDPDSPLYMRRNRSGIVPEAVGINYPVRQQYWLGIPTIRSNRGFDVIIVWDYKENTVTLYEFCNQFLSMVVGKDQEGNPRVYLGDDKGFVWVADLGNTDGVGRPGNTGTVKGTVTDSEDTFSFEDEDATFIEGGIPALGGLSGAAGLSPFLDEVPMGMAGACVYFREPGVTEWTQRTVWAASKQRVYFTPPLAANLAVGSEYMLGPINFSATIKPTNMGMDSEQKRTIDLFVVHVPEAFDSRLKVEALADFADEDERAGAVRSDDTDVPGDRIFLMSNKKGRQNAPLGRIKHGYMGYRLTNFAPEEPIRIVNIVPTYEITP